MREDLIIAGGNKYMIDLRGTNGCIMQIGQGNVVKNTIISSNNKLVVVGNEVTINDVKMPPCPAQGHNSTIIGNKVYLNGYELVNGKWKKTLKALWHKWF